MPKLGSISHRALIQKLRAFGFDGPSQDGKHPYMSKGTVSITIPNPHEKEISPDLISRILRQAGIKREEWDKKR